MWRTCLISKTRYTKAVNHPLLSIVETATSHKYVVQQATTYKTRTILTFIYYSLYLWQCIADTERSAKDKHSVNNNKPYGTFSETELIRTARLKVIQCHKQIRIIRLRTSTKQVLPWSPPLTRYVEWLQPVLLQRLYNTAHCNGLTSHEQHSTRSKSS